MVDPVPMVHEELTAPDLRYAVLIVLVVVLFVRRLQARLSRSSAQAAPALAAPDAVAARVVAGLGCGLAIGWVLWLRASGNSRYFLPMPSIAAVLIVALIFQLFAQRPKVRNYLLATIIGLQVIQFCCGANFRWNWLPWQRQWLAIDMPEKLATEPNLYLTVGTQSNSFIAAYLAKGSGLINFSQGYALGPEGASGARIEALMQRYSPNLRVLWRSSRPPFDAESNASARTPVDDALQRFNLRVDKSDCSTITVHGLPPETEIIYTGSEPLKDPKPARQESSDTAYLGTCHVVPDSSDHSAQIAREQAVDRVFDRVEDACPALFQPRRFCLHRRRNKHV